MTVAGGLLALAFLSACSGDAAQDESTQGAVEQPTLAPETEPLADGAPAAFAWPASLKVMGTGYPEEGDACRRLGESAAVVDYLDDSAMLVGCPGEASSGAAQALVSASSAQSVGHIDGVSLFSVPATPVAAPSTAPVRPGTQFKGRLTGNDIARHDFSAREGQTINVTLKGSGSMYFNVLPPGGQPGDAIYVGSRAIERANFWSGVAPASGTYTVIVYLMGNDRDGGASRSYELEAIAE